MGIKEYDYLTKKRETTVSLFRTQTRDRTGMGCPTGV